MPVGVLKRYLRSVSINANSCLPSFRKRFVTADQGRPSFQFGCCQRKQGPTELPGRVMSAQTGASELPDRDLSDLTRVIRASSSGPAYANKDRRTFPDRTCQRKQVPTEKR